VLKLDKMENYPQTPEMSYFRDIRELPIIMIMGALVEVQSAPTGYLVNYLVELGYEPSAAVTYVTESQKYGIDIDLLTGEASFHRNSLLN
jgi:hypothetical protein